MKSILVPIEKHDLVTSMLDCATRLAGMFSGTVEGVALRLPQISVVGPDPVVTVTFPRAEQEDLEILASSRRIFDAYFATEAAMSPLAGQRPRHHWRAIDPVDDAALGSLARVYDVTVVGRPQGGTAGPRMTTLEAVLFESGRPLLIAPPVPPRSLGERIVISWNCSTESARTVAYAMPLLLKAREVAVLTVEGAVSPGPSGKELADCLAVHGIEARELTVLAGGRKPGAAILEEAQRLGADLLVKGAYTQSRLRQMIFGGATSHILSSTELPVLMAH
ncbi:MAG: universal stress protein [Hyphomicrobiaceae bacterium]|nr:universal stress protein [Hyphomicrobiaceae bacterium]